MTLGNNRALILYYAKLWASFQCHWWIETGVTVRIRSIRTTIRTFCPAWPQNSTDCLENNRAYLFCYFNLRASFPSHWWIQTRVEIPQMTLKNNKAHPLSIIKLCASFYRHAWTQIWVMVRKRLCWVLTTVTLTFDLWPCPFAWTSLLSLVINHENSMMIRWGKYSEEGVTERRTDGRTDGLNHSKICLVAFKSLKYVKQFRKMWLWVALIKDHFV